MIHIFYVVPHKMSFIFAQWFNGGNFHSSAFREADGASGIVLGSKRHGEVSVIYWIGPFLKLLFVRCVCVDYVFPKASCFRFDSRRCQGLITYTYPKHVFSSCKVSGARSLRRTREGDGGICSRGVISAYNCVLAMAWCTSVQHTVWAWGCGRCFLAAIDSRF